MTNRHHSQAEEDFGAKAPRATRSVLSELIESQHRAKTLKSASDDATQSHEQISKGGLHDSKVRLTFM